MSWYEGITRLFTPKIQNAVWDNTPVRMEIENFEIGDSIKLYYPEETNYVDLQEKNYVLSDVLGKIAKTFSNACFEDENEESELLNKINEPNDKQSKEEFLKEFAIYLLASGYGMIWKKYVSFGNFETLQLININPDPKKTQITKNNVITEIDGKKETIRKLDIIFFYDIKKNNNDDKGYSRIKPLRSQVKNIEDAQRAKNIQICNSGTTIVSPKANPSANNNIDEGLNTPNIQPITGIRTQQQDMEDKLNSRGISNRIIVSTKGVDAVNLSAQLNNLDFYKIVEQDILAVYDAFGFPAELSPYGKNATFENKPAAENMLIENEVLPLAQSFVKSLNSEFESRGNIDVNYNHLSSVATTKNKVYETNKTIAETYSGLSDKGIITTQDAKRILENMGVL